MMADQFRLTKKQSMPVHRANQGYGSRISPLGRASPSALGGKAAGEALGGYMVAIRSYRNRLF